MERQELESLTMIQLKEEARRLGILVSDDRMRIIDAILNQLERRTRQDEQASLRRPALAATDGAVAGPPGQEGSDGVAALQQVCVALALQIQQQQVLAQILLSMRDMCGVLSGHQPADETPSQGQPSPATSVEGTSLQQSQLSLSTVSSAQAVNLLVSQIPEFASSKTENVQMWIKRIKKVAEIHSAPQRVIYLAASSKLVGPARKWFELGSGNMLESWIGFKDAINKRFTRKLLFHVALQKIKAQKWNFAKETFHEYALQKLMLMHSLNL